MHRDYYAGGARCRSKRYGNRQSGVLHALDLRWSSGNHHSADDGRGWDAAGRPAGRAIGRRCPAAADGPGAREGTFQKLMARRVSLRGALAAVCLLLICGAGAAAEPFPFGQELLLDAGPMRPGKRMPILTVETNGDARIDLWCRTVPARVKIADMAMKIEAAPLSEELPAMQGA